MCKWEVMASVEDLRIAWGGFCVVPERARGSPMSRARVPIPAGYDPHPAPSEATTACPPQ